MEYISNINRPLAGDELDHLVNHLKNLKGYLLKLDGQAALYICDKDGYVVYGVLSEQEAEAPRKRLRAEIEKKISEVEKKIRAKVSG